MGLLYVRHGSYYHSNLGMLQFAVMTACRACHVAKLLLCV